MFQELKRVLRDLLAPDPEWVRAYGRLKYYINLYLNLKEKGEFSLDLRKVIIITYIFFINKEKGNVAQVSNEDQGFRYMVKDGEGNRMELLEYWKHLLSVKVDLKKAEKDLGGKIYLSFIDDTFNKILEKYEVSDEYS